MAKIVLLFEENKSSTYEHSRVRAVEQRSVYIHRDLRIVFFCVRIESRIESAVYTSEYLIHSIGIYFVCVTNESDARN